MSNCKHCNSFLMYQHEVDRGSCFFCREMRESFDKKVRHYESIRCPHCKHVQEALGDDHYNRYEEGPHDVYCDECDEEYEFVTYVTYTFESPECTES